LQRHPWNSISTQSITYLIKSVTPCFFTDFNSSISPLPMLLTASIASSRAGIASCSSYFAISRCCCISIACFLQSLVFFSTSFFCF
jgi:hypothetical protein